MITERMTKTAAEDFNEPVDYCGKERFAKVRSALYVFAGIGTALGGLAMAGVGIATRNDQLTAAGMGLLIGTIVPAIAAVNANGKATEYSIAASRAAARE